MQRQSPKKRSVQGIGFKNNVFRTPVCAAVNTETVGKILLCVKFRSMRERVGRGLQRLHAVEGKSANFSVGGRKAHHIAPPAKHTQAIGCEKQRVFRLVERRINRFHASMTVHGTRYCGNADIACGTRLANHRVAVVISLIVVKQLVQKLLLTPFAKVKTVKPVAHTDVYSVTFPQKVAVVVESGRSHGLCVFITGCPRRENLLARQLTASEQKFGNPNGFVSAHDCRVSGFVVTLKAAAA